VLAIGTECDLALLDVEDGAFWRGIVPLELGGLPALPAEAWRRAACLASCFVLRASREEHAGVACQAQAGHRCLCSCAPPPFGARRRRLPGGVGGCGVARADDLL
jgi:hypothetical protein